MRSVLQWLLPRAGRARERTDSALRESSARAELSFVTEHAAVLLAHCDREGRYIFVNRVYAERFGVTPESVPGKRIADVIGEQAFRVIQPFMERTLSGERVEFEIEVPYETHPRFMHCVYVPDIDPRPARRSGSLPRFQTSTERRRPEERLREADRRKDEFLAVLRPRAAQSARTHSQCRAFPEGKTMRRRQRAERLRHHRPADGSPHPTRG